MATIIVELPKDRTQLGTLRLVSGVGDLLAGPFVAYGKADNGTAHLHGNDGADATKPYGDTPSGKYAVGGTVPTGDGTNHPTGSYGPNGAIILNPLSGDALTAKQNGRTGLLIHGGRPGPNGGLRRTNGCIRLSNDDVKALIQAIGNLPPDDGASDSSVNELDVVVVNTTLFAEADDGTDDGDPPPDFGGPIS